MPAILERALEDAATLAEGGAAGVIVENIGDAPFSASTVEPHVVGALSIVAKAIVDRWGATLSVGINALRNDSLSALGAAAASGADFVRVNVHTGVMVTDQGLIEGKARASLLYRKQLGVPVGIAADVLVKHATPLGSPDPVQLAQDTFYRGGADVLIHTGSGTGKAVDAGELEALRSGCPGIPFWIGSGLNLNNVEVLGALCEGAIVGTALHEGGQLDAPLDPTRVRAMVEALRAL